MGWMRNRSDSEPEATSNPQPTAASEPAAPAPRRENIRMEKVVNIGQSVQIKGELNGNEDLTIEGMVDGKILVKDHHLTIGANGRIKAEVHAKTVTIVGQVIGNITADDKVEISPSGSVQGDVRAPRVAIADGARFKGSIDMEGKGGAASAGASSTSSSTTTAKQPQAAHPPRDMPVTAGSSKG